MTTLQRYFTFLVAASTLVLTATLLHAQNPPTTQSLIAVLESRATSLEKARACQQLTALGAKEAVPALATLLADDKLAVHARTALEIIADPSAAAALREALDRLQGKLRAGVVNSLGVRRDVQAVKILQKLAGDRTSGVADEALLALGRIATPEAVATLQKTLVAAGTENRPAAAEACLACTDQLLAQGKKTEALALLEQVRQAEVPSQMRAAAIFSIILARQTGDLSLLLEQLKSDDRALFAVAMRATRFLPGTEVTKVLLAELGHLPPARQALVIGVLAERKDPAAWAAVQKAASSGPSEVRRVALQALGQAGDAGLTPLLVDTALAADASLAQAARESLLQTRAKGTGEALAVRLGQVASKDRLMLLDLIGQRGDAAATAHVVKLVDDPTGEVRQAAMQTLGRIVSTKELPVLLGLWHGARTPEEKAVLQQALRTTCGRVPDPDELVRKLQASMAGAPLANQCFILELLGQTGGKEALAVVTTHARDNRPEVQETAIRVLCGWINIEASPTLMDLVKTLENPKLKSRCLQGVLRIARQRDLPADKRLGMCEEVFRLTQQEDDKRQVVEAAKAIVRSGVTPAQLARAQAVIAQVPLKKGPLFDGRSFEGWEGDTKHTFRIQDEGIVGGNLKTPIPRNEFLCTTRGYANFVLRVECKLVGPANGGIQIRSQRIPNHNEVSGYQADMSADANGGYWGCLYDESRRNRMLAKPDPAALKKALKANDWNLYEIRCEGPRIRLSLNGVPMVDFTETDGKIPASGIIGLQIHGGRPSEAWYRNVTIEELP